MYFEVENGAGSPTANTYITVSDADDYIALHEDGIEKWMGLEEERKEVLLIRASRFLDTMVRWQSQILNDTQALAWPRAKFTDNEGRLVEGVPRLIEDATAALAFASLTDALTTDVEKLSSTSFGDTTDTYATSVTVGNTTVRDLSKNFIFRGYGRNRVTIVDVIRG